MPSFHGLQSPLGQRCHFDVPLQREVRLDHGLAAVAAAHRHGVVIDLLQQTGGFQVGHDACAGVEAVQPLVLVTGGVDDAGLVEDVDLVQAMAQADLKVVEIVGRGDLDHAGAELAIHIVIGDDRDLAV